MTVVRIAAGVLVVNAVFTFVGYCVVGRWLRGRGLAARLSFAGVALVVGATLTGVVLSAALVFGARTDPVAFLAGAAALGATALVAARRFAPANEAEPRPAWSSSPVGDLVATASCFGLAAVAGFGLAGGLRSSPWLDDVWKFWVPKGLVYDRIGLHADVLLGGTTLPYLNPQYPPLWSIVTDLDLRFAGSVDLRAVNFQTAILLVAFVGAVARLLWGRVRPVILFPCLLAFLASPAAFRQAQSGEADLPLACFLAVVVLAALIWLERRDGLALVVAFAGAAGAIAIKVEGRPETIVAVVALGVLAYRAGADRTRQAGLWAVGLAAFLATLPWYAWVAVHHVPSSITVRHALDLLFLSEHRGQAERATRQLLRFSSTPREWLPIVPALFVVTVGGVLRARKSDRLLVLAPVLVLLLYGVVVMGFWADSNDWTINSFTGYRVVTPVIVVAAVLLPLALERVVTLRGP